MLSSPRNQSCACCGEHSLAEAGVEPVDMGIPSDLAYRHFRGLQGRSQGL